MCEKIILLPKCWSRREIFLLHSLSGFLLQKINIWCFPPATVVVQKAMLVMRFRFHTKWHFHYGFEWVSREPLLALMQKMQNTFLIEFNCSHSFCVTLQKKNFFIIITSDKSNGMNVKEFISNWRAWAKVWCCVWNVMSFYIKFFLSL